ncbi:nucleotidyl transferase AbiEii/AbiGii toxin family protein [Ahniella affigens]|nr:nucleotidyl transferase AbiEii/AbiGii toxin family protein [Ahniella affigens]
MNWWQRWFGPKAQTSPTRTNAGVDWSTVFAESPQRPALSRQQANFDEPPQHEPSALTYAETLAPAQKRATVYDPALQHFPRGLTLEPPTFADSEEQAAWQRQQQDAMNLVLRAIALSAAADHLVLRGSALMLAWYGDAARPPKDLDFVVVPKTMARVSDEAEALIETIITAVIETAQSTGWFAADQITRDTIWTYCRVDGLRLTFFWKRDPLPWGSVQVDLTFGEHLPRAPVPTRITMPNDPNPYTMLTADRPMALAWKLYWLGSDMHQRAKDVYDAMLLAEDGACDIDTIRAVSAANDFEPTLIILELFERFDPNHLEWVGFQIADPLAAQQWAQRLRNALPEFVPSLTSD